jgi:hypothetical protein
MWRRLTLVVLTALLLGTWALCANTYATSGGGGYNGGIWAVLIVVAASSTLAAGIALVRAWHEVVGVLAASVLSVFASLAVIALGIAINSRG